MASRRGSGAVDSTDRNRKAVDFDWDKITELLNSTFPEPPKNSFSIFDFQKKYNVARKTASDKLKKLEDAGKLKSGTFYDVKSKVNRKYYWGV